MAETYTLIDGKEVTYAGILSVQGLFKTIDRFFAEHHWDKNEVKNFEQVDDGGKQITLELMPWRKVSDYAKEEIRVFMILSQLNDVDIDVDGAKRTYQTGRVYINFDAYLITDYEEYWEGKALYYFFRVLVDKFIRRSYTERWKQHCIATCHELQDEIKSYLNMNRYLTGKTVHAHPA